MLSEPTRAASLREMIPDYLTVANPVDNGAQFLLSAPVEERQRVFDLIAADPAIDVVVVGITGALGRLTDRFAEDIAAFADNGAKPVVATWNSLKTDEPGFAALVDAGVPLFRSFRECFGALRSFAPTTSGPRRGSGPASPCPPGSRPRPGPCSIRRRPASRPSVQISVEPAARRPSRSRWPASPCLGRWRPPAAWPPRSASRW